METQLSDGEILAIADELAHAALYEVTSDAPYTPEDTFYFRKEVRACNNAVSEILYHHGWFSDKAFAERWITIWQSRSIRSHFE